jgi:two-component system alkaline phosphatase synthesis response regulator PhoP
MTRKRILVIDDEIDFCNFVKLGLRLLGNFDVSIATGGREGLKLARRLKPHLILLDILMPDMNGLEVLEKLKKDKKTMTIPIVMITALGDDEHRIKASQLYNEEYLVKPISLENLKIKIEDILKIRGIK